MPRPVTPATRRSNRVAHHSISPIANRIATPQAPSSTGKAAREIGNNQKPKMKEKEVIEISDDEDDPPTVEVSTYHDWEGVHICQFLC